ncbi:MAG TPA: branched-chain amino acid ABC transporter permease [Streptosporangiaceae bacterium]|nr:branched-chain amino acid ABC transporter permease [Streptosporangiaceae bacterium]
MTLLRHAGIAIVAVIVLLVLSSKLDAYRQYQLAQVAATVIAVAGLTVLIGISGQISIGHGAFMFVGGYATALLVMHLNWPLYLVIVASAVVAGLAGAIMGAAAARLRGPYLAGATLMLAVALPAVAYQWQGVFGGDQGLDFTVTTPGFLGASFQLTEWQAWVCCVCAVIVLLLLANLLRSRVGRSWRALRDNETAAALAGLNVGRLRVLAFVVSASCAGVAGSLLAMTMLNVTPGAFTLALSIQLLTAVVLGGLGSLAGAVWGGIVLVLIPPFLTNFAASHGFSAASASVPVAGYGLVLIVVMLAFPAGIQGGVRRLLGPLAPSTPAAPGAAGVLGARGPASALRRSRLAGWRPGRAATESGPEDGQVGDGEPPRLPQRTDGIEEGTR